jgi:hypothetical protein
MASIFLKFEFIIENDRNRQAEAWVLYYHHHRGHRLTESLVNYYHYSRMQSRIKSFSMCMKIVCVCVCADVQAI